MLIAWRNSDFKNRNRIPMNFDVNISSKVKINFEENSDRNPDEINFGGNPSLLTCIVNI
jgi:hypothetical protein